MVSPTQLSVLRMVPVAGRIARAGRGRLAVLPAAELHARLGRGPHPGRRRGVGARQLRERFGTTYRSPWSGTRSAAARRSWPATSPAVRTVVALAPWVYADDGRRDLSGRRVLVVHGDRDRIASPAALRGGGRRTCGGRTDGRLHPGRRRQARDARGTTGCSTGRRPTSWPRPCSATRCRPRCATCSAASSSSRSEPTASRPRT